VAVWPRHDKAFLAEGARVIVLADLDKDAVAADLGCAADVANYAHRQDDGVDRGLEGLQRARRRHSNHIETGE
jgi:hypothetical protein